MLGDEDGLLVPLDVGEQLRGLALERGDEFGAHASDTKVSLAGPQASARLKRFLHPNPIQG
jgi:hypothetical protein